MPNCFILEDTEIKDLKENRIFAKDIIKYSKIVDAQLTRKFGSWKNLDSISVEEYMYSKAISKLNINRQFEQVIKDSSIDCSINKNGNIIRLDERYYPESMNDVYKLYYENYSNGKKYLRQGIRSKFNPSLPEGLLTFQDILENTAKNSKSFNFISMDTLENYKINKNLIIPEDNDCEAGNIDYSFTNIPEKIVNLTINKELIKYIMKIPLKDIKKFIKNIEIGKIKVSDPKIISKIKKLYNKESLLEKDQIIIKLQELGVGDYDTPWELESLESLKKIYKLIKK